jgi:hypothetical protein
VIVHAKIRDAVCAQRKIQHYLAVIKEVGLELFVWPDRGCRAQVGAEVLAGKRTPLEPMT